MDERNLEAALARNLDAHFERVVTLYQAPLYRFALRLSGCREDAEEIAQDGLIRAYHALAGYPAERIRSLSLRPWLYQITLNVFRNRVRRRTLTLVPLDGDLLDGSPPPEWTVEAKERQLDLAQLLLSLPEGYRAAILLRHVEGLRYREVAEVLEQPVGTVKAAVHRGLAMLRASMEQGVPA